MAGQRIECALMRGGSSKGVVMAADALAAKGEQRSALLEQLLGADAFQCDGLGGGHPLTSKVALVSVSARDDADLDYRFVQVMPGRGSDAKVTCGNMLAAVGPFAIETGMLAAADPQTVLTINDINLNSLVEVVVQTPGGKLTYAGDAALPGVPGTSAPIAIRYRSVDPIAGAGLWPSGKVRDRIEGVDITLVDAAVPVMIVTAEQLGWSRLPGLRGMNNREAIKQILHLRDACWQHAGFVPSRKSVLPKVAVVAAAEGGANLAVRYYTPHNMHRSMAVSGMVALGFAAAVEGTVAAACARRMQPVIDGGAEFTIEHVAGTMSMRLAFRRADGQLVPRAASLMRTARMLMRGAAYLPGGR